jgi:hypothetical protein
MPRHQRLLFFISGPVFRLRPGRHCRVPRHIFLFFGFNFQIQPPAAARRNLNPIIRA